MFIKRENFADVYRALLFELYNKPQFVCKPRDQKINEILNCSFEIENVNKNLYKNVRRSSPKKYIAAELFWYLSKDLNAKEISKYASLWEKISDENGNVCSNYGNLIFGKQYQWAIQSLIKDKDSRQAIFHFNNESHQFFDNKDFVCTMFGQFFIRENKLYLSIHMRSNDVIFGLSSDYPFFNLIHQNTFLILKTCYPELEMGSYYHYTGSMHLYERHFPLVKEMLGYSFLEDSLPELDKPFLSHLTGDVIKTDPKLFEYMKTLLTEGE